MKDLKNQAVVDESNRLLQQLNTHLLVIGDTNGNNKDFTLVDIPVVDNYKKDDGDSYLRNREDEQVNSQENNRKESSTSSDADFNDPAKVIGRVGEEHMRNVFFFLGFVAKFLQLVVASALLILAIEWRPLHQILQDHVDNLFISFLILALSCAGLLLLRFRGRFMLILLINMLFIINFFWYMAAASFDFSIFSPYWVVLCAVTATADCFLLGVLVYFQRATYRGWAIYCYAAMVPLLFLILSQPYYFWWYVKFTEQYQQQQEIITVTSSESTTEEPLWSSSPSPTIMPIASEEIIVRPDDVGKIERIRSPEELIMSYPYYMINVCSGIGLATIMTFEMVAWSQHAVKGLRFKAGTGILSGSFTALADDGSDAESPPVNL